MKTNNVFFPKLSATSDTLFMYFAYLILKGRGQSIRRKIREQAPVRDEKHNHFYNRQSTRKRANYKLKGGKHIY